MQYANVWEYMGKTAAIIAAAAGLIDFVLNKFCTKTPKFLLRYGSAVLAVAANLIVDAIAEGEFAFSLQALYGGALSASLGKLLSFTLIRITNGEKPDENAIVTLIEGLLFNYIPCDDVKKAATEIAKTIIAITDPDLNSPETEKKIAGIILHNVEGVTETQADSVARLIISSVYSFKN